MNNIMLLNKENPDIPDFFTIQINYLTGRKEKLDVVSCRYLERLNALNEQGQLITVADHYDSYEIWTKDDIMKVVPRASIESIDYDKNFTKFLELQKEKKNERS